MSTKSWKDHLLSSGLPLEQSVIQILESVGIGVPREYKYERINELGLPALFSVDVYAHVMEPRWLEFFIECKYRHDGTRWVFIPTEYESLLDEGFHETFTILDQLADKDVDVWRIHDKYSDLYDLCGKGVELLSDNANPKSIEESIQQLRYALIEEVVDYMVSQVCNPLGTSSPIRILIPVIVTTAELWRINPGTTIEAVRQATELREVAQCRDAIVVKKNPDNQLTRHTKSKFQESLTEEQKSMLDTRLKQMGPFQGYSHFLSAFSSYHPSLFLVINYVHFADRLQNLLSIFEDTNLIKKKSKPKNQKSENSFGQGSQKRGA